MSAEAFSPHPRSMMSRSECRLPLKAMTPLVDDWKWAESPARGANTSYGSHKGQTDSLGSSSPEVTTQKSQGPPPTAHALPLAVAAM